MAKGKFQTPRNGQPSQARQAQNRSRRKRRSHGGLIALLVGLILLGAFGGMTYYGHTLKTGDTIYPNVHVAGVNVGGMTRLEAIDAVNTKAKEAYDTYSLTVELPDRTLTFTPEQTGVAVNAEDAVDEAMRHGRRGNPLAALSGWLEARNTAHHIDLQTALDLDTDYIRDLIDQTAEEVEQPLIQSRIVYDETAGKFTVTIGQPARHLDADGLYKAVYNGFMTGNYDPIPWTYEETPYDLVDLSGYYRLYCTEVADAYYDEAAKTVVEEVRGYGFDLAAANQQIALAKPGETVTVTMTYTDPVVTKAQVEEQLFGNLLHAVSSPYVNNANRTTNLRLACEAINGTILNPGEVFSFNAIVGERTAEKGYKGATVYVSGGASESQLGGGICQVASTIYYGTLHLDLEQVQREPHMYAVTYVPMGMDAAIYWDIGQDYKFRNTNSNPMKVMAWLENGKVNIAFYGIAENSNTIKMTYEILETYPYEEVEEVDETKPYGYREETTTPYTGYKVVTYKTIYDENGNQISHDIEVYSTYKKRDRVFTVGPAEEDPWIDPDDPWLDPDDPWIDYNDNWWFPSDDEE